MYSSTIFLLLPLPPPHDFSFFYPSPNARFRAKICSIKNELNSLILSNLQEFAKLFDGELHEVGLKLDV